MKIFKGKFKKLPEIKDFSLAIQKRKSSLDEKPAQSSTKTPSLSKKIHKMKRNARITHKKSVISKR